MIGSMQVSEHLGVVKMDVSPNKYPIQRSRENMGPNLSRAKDADISGLLKPGY